MKVKTKVYLMCKDLEDPLGFLVLLIRVLLKHQMELKDNFRVLKEKYQREL